MKSWLKFLWVDMVKNGCQICLGQISKVMVSSINICCQEMPLVWPLTSYHIWLWRFQEGDILNSENSNVTKNLALNFLWCLDLITLLYVLCVSAIKLIFKKFWLDQDHTLYPWLLNASLLQFYLLNNWE